MTDRFGEMMKFTKALIEASKVRNEIDVNVLEEDDLAILKGFDEFVGLVMIETLIALFGVKK